MLKTMVAKSLFGINESAQRLGISPHTVRRRIRLGEISSITIGSRRLIPFSEVERIEQHGLGVSRRERYQKAQAAKVQDKLAQHAG